MTKDDIIQRIKSDFPLLPLPETVVASLGGGFEPELIQDYFQGKDWLEIARDGLRGYEGPTDGCLFFMTPNAFCYYLPAYLLMFLESYDPFGHSTMYDATFYSLTVHETEKAECLERDWRLACFERLNLQQKQDIANYLEYEDRVHGEESGNDAKKALDSFWYQFL